ncbi:MAG: chloride channel protein [Alphaproteobacteria bacterium]|nr:MAG: chloride channel protein [Alphaproteobacteria bacterium]
MSRLLNFFRGLPEHEFVRQLHWSKMHWQRQPGVWIVALIIGIGVGYAIIGFRALIDGFSFISFGATEASYLDAVKALPDWQLVLIPTVGAFIVGLLLKFWVPGERAHAVADLIESRALHGGRMNTVMGLKSSLIAALSLGTGASTGREGPAAHLGAALTGFVTRTMNYPPRVTKILMAAGAASAVAASFNAPIAGVIFALEVILGFYTARAFAPIVIASVAGALVCRLHIGAQPAFQLPEYQLQSIFEVPAFALLGLVAGLGAVLFMRLSVLADRAQTRMKLDIVVRTTLGGFLVGLIAIVFPEVMGVGYGPTDNALKGEYGLLFLIALFGAKLLATTISLASRHGGGVFSPSLFLGAMVGGAFGIIAASIFPGYASEPGLYAIIGMGAVSAAILGAPISTTLIVFELTGDYGVMIALMIATSVSTVLTQAMFGRSLFHFQIESHGYHVAEGPQQLLLETLEVRDAMTPDPEAAAAEQGSDLPTLTLTDSLEYVFDTFEKSGAERLLVVEHADEDQILGYVTYQRALQVFNKALIEANIEEHL